MYCYTNDVFIVLCWKKMKTFNHYHLIFFTDLTSIICQVDTTTVSCPANSVINIVSANYGRTEPGAVACPHWSIVTTACFQDQTAWVAARCHGNNQCSLGPFDNSVFSNPCLNTYKYLEIDYNCTGKCGNRL
jgi:hypothetical protein